MGPLKRTLDKTLYWITVILFAFLVFVVVWQVFTRLVLSDPATWTDEGARLTFVWLGLFASAFVFGERGHIAVEFLARRFPTRIERLLSILVQLVLMGFSLVVLIWGGWRASQNAWGQHLSALPFTVGQMYLALPITGVLITFYAAYYIQALVRDLEKTYPNTSDEDDPEMQVDKYVDRSTVLPGSATDTSPDGDIKTNEPPRGP